MSERLPMDNDLHMVRESVRNPNMNHLRLLRFQAERGDFGPKPLSVPRGDNCFRMTDAEVRKYAMIQADQQAIKPIGPTTQFEQQH